MTKNASDPCILYSTFPSMAAAEYLGRKLVDQRLAACVNILPSMISLYRWDNEINREEETVMLIKSRWGQFEAIRLFVQKNHPYDVPAFFALEIGDGNSEFFKWISAQTK